MVTTMKATYEFNGRFYIEIDDTAGTNCQLVTLTERRLRSLRASIDAALKAKREREGR